MTDISEIIRAGSGRIRGLSAAVIDDASYVAASITWMPQGACQGEDPELFFPAGQAPALRQVSAARAICRRCAVAAKCLTYAVETGQTGIWGGTTWEERRALTDPQRGPASEWRPRRPC